MKKLIRVLKYLLKEQSVAGKNYLMVGVRIYSANDLGQEWLDLVGDHQNAIDLLCEQIKKNDLVNLSWSQLWVLTEATRRDSKLREWVLNRQKELK